MTIPVARQAGFAVAVLLSFAAAGCSDSPKVVVYTALDQGFSQPVFNQFTKETGIQVHAKFDVESTKTVGLVNSLIAERDHPRCDLFWNNELLHTLRLKKLGLLDVYMSNNGQAFPKQFRAGDGSWYGFAGRARVLIVNTRRLKASATTRTGTYPNSILDLADPKWKGQVGIAKPLFGTTATHSAVLFDVWGAARAKKFFRQVKANAEVMGGNKGVAQAVASGQLVFGITDTDDAIIELDAGYPVKIVFPDQAERQMGALMIPNSLALIKGGPNRKHAEQLAEYLLAKRLEAQLAKAQSAQFQLNPGVTERPRVAPKEPVRWMQVDFESAAAKWHESAQFLRELFHRAD